MPIGNARNIQAEKAKGRWMRGIELDRRGNPQWVNYVFQHDRNRESCMVGVNVTLNSQDGRA